MNIKFLFQVRAKNPSGDWLWPAIWLLPLNQVKFNSNQRMNQGWYVQFLIKIELEFLLIKTTASLNFKIDHGSLYTYPGIATWTKIQIKNDLPLELMYLNRFKVMNNYNLWNQIWRSFSMFLEESKLRQSGYPNQIVYNSKSDSNDYPTI